MRRVFLFVMLFPVLLGLVYAPSPAKGADSYNELFGLGSHSEDADLVGWWKLQETSGTTASDSSTAGLDGTTSGATVNQTGPGGAFPLAYNFDGSNDYVTLTGTDNGTIWGLQDGVTLLSRVKQETQSVDQCHIGTYEGASFNHQAAYAGLNTDGSIAYRVIRAGTNAEVRGATDGDIDLDDGSWHTVALIGQLSATPASNTLVFRIDKASAAFTYTEQSNNNATFPNDTNKEWVYPFVIGARNLQGTVDQFFDGSIADVSIFSRALTTTEADQWADGPEPIYSGGGISSPVGTYTIGQTLTAVTDSGNWDTQSNGTLVYAYQWIRADDGTGTNAAEISGATSSTYTLVSGDSGKHIACDILASNDGGSDAAEETRSAYTSQVSGGGGPAITPITTSIPGSSVDPIRGTIP